MTTETRRLTALKRFAATTSLVTLCGHAFLGFEQSYATPVVGLVAAYLTQLVLEWAHARAQGTAPRFAGGLKPLVHFLLPAHIVGLTCAMFVYPGERLWPIAFAATLAIATKFLFVVRIGGHPRHFLNPSNAGILATLVLFPAVGIILPYQFSSLVGDTVDVLLPVALLVAGTVLNARVTHRLFVVIGWLGSFVVQALIRHAAYDATILAMIGPATGAVGMLFTFFMVTDPATTPEKPGPQLLYGAAVGLLYGALFAAHIIFALFWALFAICCARGLYHAVRGALAAAKSPPSVQTMADEAAPDLRRHERAS